MYFAYRFDTTEDPQLLANALWHHKVAHQIVENQGAKELWLLDASQQPTVLQLIAIWKEDPSLLQNSLVNKPTERTAPTNLMAQVKRSPLTMIVLLISFVVAIITELGENLSLVSLFTISPFNVSNGHIYFMTLSDVMAKGEYWRLLTPAFLHFSVIHIVFNCLWVWDVGRKLEMMVGKFVWLFSVLITAVLSNVLQYYFSGYPIFGGLSGVVYGLIGFAWLLPILRPYYPVLIHKGLMIFFMIWLVVGYTSLPETMGLGRIANTAHTIGLISGLALCVCFWLFEVFFVKQQKYD
ncbi:rhomboid family intramembrane serine protease [Marinomonas posidonica]|uniref:Rhomboid family protein n=1 Tax=Marinomonas posidonica (strain CECT 7376 / NCIMB 14433 / IVIA-Po-181) TaxID=491952 RepID=F6D156_MARPP|nr:rhomboid family intramembrane serine protease [Marinomonas posidonica]AEF54863.1 Rhomboid family protein [Marinomonas posidonica IVIA-Po-181]